MSTHTTPSPPEAVRWLADHARPLLLQRFTPDCCIESTVLALDFLRARGIACREFSAQVLIYNATGWELYRQGSNIKADPTEEALWDTLGAWSIGIGFIDTPMPKFNRFAGHLVALVEDRWLLDLSIEQASRPQRNIPIDRPLLGLYHPKVLEQGQPYDGPNGSVIIYRRNTTFWANVYKSARPWTDRRQRREILAMVEAAYAADRGVADAS